MIHTILIQTEITSGPIDGQDDLKEETVFLFSQRFGNPKILAETLAKVVRSKFGDGFTEQFLFQLTKEIIKK